MTLTVTIVFTLVQAWFGYSVDADGRVGDRVSITTHPTLEACEAAKISGAKLAKCLGPYEIGSPELEVAR